MEQGLVLIGSGGCMREILWQIEELNKKEVLWKVLGYVDVKPHLEHGTSDIFVGSVQCPYLGDDDYLLARQQETNVAVCVGEPKLRKKIAEKLMKNPKLKFPNIILGDTRICPDLKIGRGCIISMDSRISTNVKIGDFVFLNIGAMICHDGTIGSFSTLSPDVKIAGQVTIGGYCDIGLGTKIIQGITVGDKVVAGAGSVIIRNVDDNCTVAGVPARKIK